VARCLYVMIVRTVKTMKKSNARIVICVFVPENALTRINVQTENKKNPDPENYFPPRKIMDEQGFCYYELTLRGYEDTLWLRVHGVDRDEYGLNLACLFFMIQKYDDALSEQEPFFIGRKPRWQVILSLEQEEDFKTFRKALFDAHPELDGIYYSSDGFMPPLELEKIYAFFSGNQFEHLTGQDMLIQVQRFKEACQELLVKMDRFGGAAIIDMDTPRTRAKCDECLLNHVQGCDCYLGNPADQEQQQRYLYSSGMPSEEVTTALKQAEIAQRTRPVRAVDDEGVDQSPLLPPAQLSLPSYDPDVCGWKQAQQQRQRHRSPSLSLPIPTPPSSPEDLEEMERKTSSGMVLRARRKKSIKFPVSPLSLDDDGEDSAAVAAERKQKRPKKGIAKDKDEYDADEIDPIVQSDDDDDADVYDYEMINDDDDDDDRRRRDIRHNKRATRTETMTISQIGRATEINIKYIDCLMRTGTYLRDRLNYVRDQDPKLGEEIQRIDHALIDATRALGDLCPVTQTGPTQKAVPPTVPEADGSEIRFTNVARDLGIYWSNVDQDMKNRIYDRACKLHKEHYGVWPKRVNMWTSAGFKPVYYYNKDTYENTMKAALLEYLRGDIHRQNLE